MVIYDLVCEFRHQFEGWFKNSDDLATQQESGLLTCPYCNSANIAKKLSAPKLTRKSNRSQLPITSEKSELPEGASDPAKPSTNDLPQSLPKDLVAGDHSAEKFAQLQSMLAQVHDYIDDNFQDVGNRFTEEAISIHRGEKDPANIKGTVSADQIEELVEEGVTAMPLPPRPIDKKKLN